KTKMKDGHVGECISFLDEAELLFYNSRMFETQPVSNIWELTESRFSGMIYIPNPLRSFSTYAFIAATFDHADELEDAYKKWCGRDFDRKDGTAPETLWKEISKNAVFTNSSDEVMEALNTDKAMLGIMISSKLRYKNMGYGFEPAYRLTPFTGCRTTVSVMLARNSQNVNSAKLFIDFLLGGTDGTGDGYKPFRTPGAWSARTDVGDGTDTPLSEIDLLYPDADSMIARKDEFYKFWSECLKDQTNR
ncbi:MAG: substrate-binding domain-containing protein, partial [Lachnospiraceae bacterium]|nr:substrate-binding domain-containing protein [Lachnospiraceae bacterium]